MRRYLALMFLIAFASCSKEKDTSALPQWTIEGKTFTAKVFVLNNNQVRWYDVDDPVNAASTNFITVEFSGTPPQVTGTYDLGGSGTSATYIKAMNVVNNASTSNVQPYLFDNASKVGSASVTVNNGRRFITFSNVTVKKLNSSGQQTGTATLSVNFLEY
jgi:hypothetical protein